MKRFLLALLLGAGCLQAQAPTTEALTEQVKQLKADIAERDKTIAELRLQLKNDQILFNVYEKALYGPSAEQSRQAELQEVQRTTAEASRLRAEAQKQTAQAETPKK